MEQMGKIINGEDPNPFLEGREGGKYPLHL